MRDKKIIGWKETVDLPDWGVHSILAKADTGARRSAIDVKNLEPVGTDEVEFDLVLSRKDRNHTRRVRAKIAHVSRVRSSNGQEHQRYFVETCVRIGSREKSIELSLVCRKAMVCRMLLGRKALEGDFLVDSDEKYLSGRRRKPRVEHAKRSPKF